MQRFFSPLVDSDPIISRELQFLIKHADLCRKLISLVFFFFRKFNVLKLWQSQPLLLLFKNFLLLFSAMCWRHLNYLIKLKLSALLYHIFYLTQNFSLVKELKPMSFKFLFLLCVCFDNYNCKRKMLLISSDSFNADLLFMWRQRMAEECSNRKQN